MGEVQKSFVPESGNFSSEENLPKNEISIRLSDLKHEVLDAKNASTAAAESYKKDTLGNISLNLKPQSLSFLHALNTFETKEQARQYILNQGRDLMLQDPYLFSEILLKEDTSGNTLYADFLTPKEQRGLALEFMQRAGSGFEDMGLIVNVLSNIVSKDDQLQLGHYWLSVENISDIHKQKSALLLIANAETVDRVSTMELSYILEVLEKTGRVAESIQTIGLNSSLLQVAKDQGVHLSAYISALINLQQNYQNKSLDQKVQILHDTFTYQEQIKDQPIFGDAEVLVVLQASGKTRDIKGDDDSFRYYKNGETWADAGPEVEMARKQGMEVVVLRPKNNQQELLNYLYKIAQSGKKVALHIAGHGLGENVRHEQNKNTISFIQGGQMKVEDIVRAISSGGAELKHVSINSCYSREIAEDLVKKFDLESTNILTTTAGDSPGNKMFYDAMHNFVFNTMKEKKSPITWGDYWKYVDGASIVLGDKDEGIIGNQTLVRDAGRRGINLG